MGQLDRREREQLRERAQHGGVELHGGDEADLRRGRHVDGDVDAAEPLLDGTYQCRDAVELRQVCRERGRLDAGCLQRGDALLEWARPTSDEGDLVALLAEARGERGSEARTGAKDREG